MYHSCTQLAKSGYKDHQVLDNPECLNINLCNNGMIDYLGFHNSEFSLCLSYDEKH